MRCKNCGSENSDNLYICQNCGSPLYDEEPDSPDAGQTQVFSTPKTGAQTNNVVPPPAGPIRAGSNPNNNNQKPSDDEEDKKKKQTAIIIALLCVLLAIVIGITVFAVVKANKSDDEEETERTKTTEVQEDTTRRSEIETTAETTTEESTTEESTTEESTTEAKFKVNIAYNNGGEADGEGTYKLGETVTVFAWPDDGYDFGGWFINSKKVSSSESYTFTVTRDVTLQAVFTYHNDEPVEEDPIEELGEDAD